jgi:hypothetical protein
VAVTIPRVKLARTYAELPASRPGHWIIAGTPAGQPYPCTCWYDNCNHPRCPDRGRTEGDALPPGCCGRALGSHGETPEPAGGHSNTQRGRSSTRKATESPQRSTRPAGLGQRQGWERSIGPQHQVAAVSRSLDGPPLVAGDLWAAPWDAEPAPWDLDEPDPEPGSPDEASPLARETLKPAPGHANGDAPSRQHSEPSDVRWVSGPSKVESCDCKTPWDPPPPVLLIADSKTGPVRVAVALDGPRGGVRLVAEKILAERGYGLKGGWKDGRHTLLPPEGKLKTRPGFLAEVSNAASGLRESALAVIDTPPELGSGVHCPDCHVSLANAAAFQLHKPSWLAPCRPPASILTIRHRTPMLLRGPNGVWHMNKDAPFGPGGCPVSPPRAAEIWRAAQDGVKRWRFGKGHNRAR